jgi:predicted SprT family Zn-dependent metalloprotease
MDLDKVRLNLLRQHHLTYKGWNFDFNNNKCRLGVCKYDKRLIEAYCHINSEELVIDTIKHEIAHALVGFENGHNEIWQAKAIEIGARPNRCKEAVLPPGKWIAICSVCNTLYSYHKRPRLTLTYLCPKDKNILAFTDSEGNLR